MGGGGGSEVQEGGDICVHIAESLLCAEETNTTLYNYMIIKQLCVSLCACSVMANSLQPQPTRLLCPWNFPGKNGGMGCHFLLQGVFLTQGLSPILLLLLYCQEDSLPLSHPGSPYTSIYTKNKNNLGTQLRSSSWSPRQLGKNIRVSCSQ